MRRSAAPYVRHPARGGAADFRRISGRRRCSARSWYHRARRTPRPPFLRMKTYSAKPGEITRDWYVVDAEGQTLGRLATQIADRAARQGQAAVHAARRHRRLRRRRQRREDRGHRQEARRQDVLPALGLPGRPEVADAARAARAAPDRGAAEGRQGDAAQEQARPRAAHEAEDLRRPRASARGAGAEALLMSAPSPSTSAPASARRPSPA